MEGCILLTPKHMLLTTRVSRVSWAEPPNAGSPRAHQKLQPIAQDTPCSLSPICLPLANYRTRLAKLPCVMHGATGHTHLKLLGCLAGSVG